MHRFVRRIAMSFVLGTALAVLLVTSAGAAPGRSARVRGSVPPWAEAAALQAPADGSAVVGFHVYLGWRHGASVTALAKAVSDPSSARYGRYLSPARFRARFAPSTADVAAVVRWLKSQGFTIAGIPTNRLYVAATGTVAQAETAFRVQMNEYSVQGLTLRAPVAAVSVPASLAGVVTAVVGLDQGGELTHPLSSKAIAPPPAGFRNAQPWSPFWGQTIATTLPKAYGSAQPYAVRGYTPAQLRGAYGVAKAIKRGNDGSGVTVAVIDAYAAPTIVYDVDRYSNDNGIPAFTKGQFTQVWAPGLVAEPAQGDEQDWYGEETLDIEAVHSMAPGAHIVYVGALSSSDTDMDAALNWVVDHRAARIVSNSYGDAGEGVPADLIKAESAIFVQAAVEGIGLYFSSGDDGDEVANLGDRTVDWPTSSPWITDVGGTSLGVNARDDYVFETGWGTTRSVLTDNVWTPAPPGDYLYGSGGGTSKLLVEPWYQLGIVPKAISHYFSAIPGRAVPDVAMDGDPTTGMLVGETQTFSDGVSYDTYRVGGTSVSCPLFAGVMALADQRAGHAHGFANPALYTALRKGAYRDVVDPPSIMAAVRSDFANGENDTDGIVYSLRTFNQTGTLHTLPGYDDVTGLGSPDGEAFLNALSRFGPRHRH
jgi:subtilase family serine protease